MRATLITSAGTAKVKSSAVCGEWSWMTSGKLDAKKLAVSAIERIQRRTKVLDWNHPGSRCSSTKVCCCTDFTSTRFNGATGAIALTAPSCCEVHYRGGIGGIGGTGGGSGIGGFRWRRCLGGGGGSPTGGGGGPPGPPGAPGGGWATEKLPSESIARNVARDRVMSIFIPKYRIIHLGCVYPRSKIFTHEERT